MDLLVLLLVLLAIVTVTVLEHYTKKPSLKQPSILNEHVEAADLALYRYNKYQYLQSPEWATKRKQALKQAHHHCCMCNSSRHLHVHHISYKNLYKEPLSDLAVVCASCHTLIHATSGFPQTVSEYNSFYGPPIYNLRG